MKEASSANKEITQVMNAIYGVDISVFDETFLQKTIGSRCAANSILALPDYAFYLSNNTIEAQALQNSLNINYSDFFRNPLTFANLEQWILPKLIEQKKNQRELRIWSAGCAAGQEPYSLAMLLESFNAARSTAIRYRIFATDISTSMLLAAERGIYTEDAVQNIKIKYMKDYFDKEGTNYKISSRLKEHIVFIKYELFDSDTFYPRESIFGDFDIVFCSNLLFYYMPEQQQFILKKLIRSIAKDGYLITGEAEKKIAANMTELRMAAPPAAIFQSNISGGAT